MNHETSTFFDQYPDFGISHASDILEQFRFDINPAGSSEEWWSRFYDAAYINTREALAEFIADHIEKVRKAIRSTRDNGFYAELGIDPADTFAKVDIDTLASIYWRQLSDALHNGTYFPASLDDALDRYEKAAIARKEAAASLPPAPAPLVQLS